MIFYSSVLFWRWLFGGSLAIGLLLTAVLLGTGEYHFVRLPTTLLPPSVPNPFTSWELDSNCVYTFIKAFSWLNGLVAGAIPVLLALSWILPSPAKFVPPGSISNRALPGLLLRYGWTVRSLTVLALVLAANVVSFILPLTDALHHVFDEEGDPFSWALPEGAEPVS
jgi:uncharacterized membrane protein YczE